MTRRTARLAAALAAALLLTACTGGGDGPAPAAAPPTKHPVFGEKLERQVFLALRRTQKEGGNARFTQTLTFESAKGRAVRTVSGRLDFAGGTGEATIRWQVPEAYSEEVKDLLLGRAPGQGHGDAAGRLHVDGQHLTYRADTSDYWLRYGRADYDTGRATGQGPGALDHLRGTEAAVGGTLLEGLSGTEAVSRSDGTGGRTYRAEMTSTVSALLLPDTIASQLAGEDLGFGLYREKKPFPVTVTVDGRGMITHARADLSQLLGKKGSPFRDVTAVRMELALSGIGTSKPSAAAEGTVLPAGRTVRTVWEVEAGHCVDFTTGQQNVELVADIPCSRTHDGRVLAQVSFGGSAYPGASAAKGQARDACRRAYRRASADWTGEADEKGTYWFMWSDERSWRRDGGGRAVCYVVTPKGADRDSGARDAS
ncbi:hypothetical protein AB0E83_28000 [Streptomyces sp. NPDC035033]|uniref:hypothetical protein n=1 Tax=Streptomyces sp. NPDC035033 TaxID=3155368 RepID=UPI0033E64CBE